MSRSDLLSQTSLIGTFYDWPFGGNTITGREYSRVLSGTQGMPINQVNKRVNGKYPPGGDWIAWQRVGRRNNSVAMTTVRPARGKAYIGSYELATPRSDYIPDDATLFGDSALQDLVTLLEGLGAEGYAKARPAVPDFSLATTLFELKDIPGMLKQSVRLFINRVLAARPDLYYSYGRSAFFKKDKKTRLSHTAEWYLSLNFGWFPIVRAVTDFMDATKKLDVSFKQLLRDEGKPIIRRRTINVGKRFEPPSDSASLVLNPHSSIRPLHVTQCYPRVNVERSFSCVSNTECWFVAKFRYWLPEGPRDFPWNSRLRRRLLGSRITPSVAWNLMPWTFISDYFSTLGKAIENLGPGVEDQLITEYCYVCYKEDIAYTENCDILTYGFGGDVNDGVCTYTEKTKLRIRISADPFAFRFTGLVPSVKQSAILAALALK